MVKTIEQGFSEFHSRLTPTGGESDAAKSHRASIEACLKTNFGMTRFYRTGSFGNGTDISGYSDVDYFAVIPRENLTQNSSYTLQVIRNALDARFPYTGVTVRTPTVLIPFGINASEATEIVPAYYIKEENGYPIYGIPDGQGSWMQSSPDTHLAWISSENDRLNKKVKPLIRFVKAWKYYRNVPLSSFYLELYTTKYISSEKVVVYSVDLKTIFKKLWESQLANIQNPAGASGYIQPCESEAQKSDALSKLQTALTRAENAREQEGAGNIHDAFDWWNLVFGGFPSYY